MQIQENFFEFETGLLYMVSFRIAVATYSIHSNYSCYKFIPNE